MRSRVIVGNWKMHKTAAEAAAFVHRLTELAPSLTRVEAVFAPPFTALHATAQARRQAFSFSLAAQNCHWEDKGAFTGEIAPAMIKEAGCRYVILGHSERRHLLGETDDMVHKKVSAAHRHSLCPILCVGETLHERDAGSTDTVVTGQVTRGLEGLTAAAVANALIAYEPVWAIGTGRAATPAQAEAMHALIRRTVTGRWGAEAAASIRLLYGGSVTPDNIEGFLASQDVDGALVGGACLDPVSFAKILTLAESVNPHSACS